MSGTLRIWLDEPPRGHASRLQWTSGYPRGEKNGTSHFWSPRHGRLAALSLSKSATSEILGSCAASVPVTLEARTSLPQVMSKRETIPMIKRTNGRATTTGILAIRVEPLETRRLLAGIEAGVLVACGTGGNDTIAVRRTGGDDVIVTTTGVNQTFDMDDFAGVRLEACASEWRSGSSKCVQGRAHLGRRRRKNGRRLPKCLTSDLRGATPSGRTVPRPPAMPLGIAKLRQQKMAVVVTLQN